MERYAFDELDTLTRYHLRFYKAYLNKEWIREHDLEVREMIKSPPFEKLYVYTIEHALNQLNDEERSILTEENLKSNTKNWWMEYYSKSTYYRIKHRALERFIHCLHHQSMV